MYLISPSVAYHHYDLWKHWLEPGHSNLLALILDQPFYLFGEWLSILQGTKLADCCVRMKELGRLPSALTKAPDQLTSQAGPPAWKSLVQDSPEIGVKSRSCSGLHDSLATNRVLWRRLSGQHSSSPSTSVTSVGVNSTPTHSPIPIQKEGEVRIPAVLLLLTTLILGPWEPSPLWQLQRCVPETCVHSNDLGDRFPGASQTLMALLICFWDSKAFWWVLVDGSPKSLPTPVFLYSR